MSTSRLFTWSMRVAALLLFAFGAVQAWAPELLPDALAFGDPWWTTGVGLATCVNANLGQVLSGGGCAAMPLRRDWKLVERIPVARAAPGQVVRVNFKNGDIPVQNSKGQYAHVRAFRIQTRVQITAGANNDAVTAYQMRQLVSQIFLEDASGHQYIAALDGRSTVDDTFLRSAWYRLKFALPGSIAANVGAGAIERDCDIWIDLVSPAPSASPFEGLVLLSSLQTRDGNALRFRLASAFAGNPAPTGLTITGYEDSNNTPGMEVWADVVYLDQPIVDSKWCLREYTKTEKSGILNAPEARHEYIAIRPFPEDAAANDGQDAVSAIDGVSVQVGGTPVLAGNTASEVLQRQTALVGGEPNSATSLGITALDMPREPSTADAFGFRLILPPRPRESAPAGPVAYKFTTAPASSYRYLHRYVLCDDLDRLMLEKSAAGLGQTRCEVMQAVGGQIVQGVTDPTAPKVLLARS